MSSHQPLTLSTTPCHQLVDGTRGSGGVGVGVGVGGVGVGGVGVGVGGARC